MKHLPEHLGDVLTELQLSDLTLSQREAQFAEWCDATGHVALDDELVSLSNGIAVS